MSQVRSGGLDGVVVADTILSEVDGELGRLIVAGRDIEQLTGQARFEDLCLLLWGSAADAWGAGAVAPPLPSQGERAGMQIALGRARSLAFAALDGAGDALQMPDGMDALRAAAAHIDLSRAVAAGLSEEVLVTGALGVLVAAWARRRAGQAAVEPDPSLGHAADVLRMILGAPAPAVLAQGLDSYLVTVADHGMNASTFTARVVASTGSDLTSAVVAAIGALKGPLHGGAPGPVLDMLDAIAQPERAAAWLEGELLGGRRIMGMGHRIYRVRDPRALVLERTIEHLEAALLAPAGRGISAFLSSEATGVPAGAGAPGGEAAYGRPPGARLQLARAVERAAEGVLRRRHPDRPLHANVEFYTAVLLDSLGLHRALFTPMFAVGRVAGWCAHVREQRQGGRLIRPASRYVGAMPGPAPAQPALP